MNTTTIKGLTIALAFGLVGCTYVFGPVKLAQAFTDAKSQVIDEMALRAVHWAREFASGRPGPNVVTGQYRAGIFAVRLPNGFELASNSPQSKRLEYGFYGTDSLGRNYHQPPFPHMRPALKMTYTEYKERLRKLPREVWRSL